jgi:YteA family regulatory protein
MGEGELDESLRNSISELSLYDNHPGDIGSETLERSKDCALRGLVERNLQRIDAAMEALDGGSYGTCERCGRPIGEERLEALPEAVLCVQCSSRVSSEREDSDRPIEEEVLGPPFGRSFRDDDQSDYSGYGGEDTWQDAARHGTSNTPSDVPGSSSVVDAFVDSDELEGAVEDTDRLYRDEEEEEDGQLKATREEKASPEE